jgi:hypothetical protein
MDQEADRIWIRKRIGYGSGSGQDICMDRIWIRTFAWIGYEQDNGSNFLS